MAEEQRPPRVAGFAVLALLLLAVSAGPALAPHLPAGPGRLLDPPGAGVAAAALAILWTLFAWPLLARDRSARRVAADGGCLFLIGGVFVAALGRIEGPGYGHLPQTCLVLLGTVAATGAWLTGPGRRRGRDRYFLAGALVLVAVAPFANYALNEFGGLSGVFGYRVSPVLLARRAILGRAGVGSESFLLAALAVAALFLGLRAVRIGAAALLVTGSLALAEPTRVEPVLSEAYVPGRTLTLVVLGSEGTGGLRVPGGGRHEAPHRGRAEVVHVPAPPGFRRVEVGDETVELALREVRPGMRLLISIPAPDEAFVECAYRLGYQVERARPGALAGPARAWLGADGVVDPAGRLPEETARLLAGFGVPVLRTADPAGIERAHAGRGLLRRVWEEPATVLDEGGLAGLFPAATGYDVGRATRVLVFLALFVLVAVPAVRYATRRFRFAEAGLLALLPAVLGFGVLLPEAAPALPEYREDEIRVEEASGAWTIRRFCSDHGCRVRFLAESPPVVLGPGAPASTRETASGSYDVGFELERGATRIVVTRNPVAGASREGEFDLFVSPAGLAFPNEGILPAAAFLRELKNRRGAEAEQAVRKLLRLADVPDARFGVVLPGDSKRYRGFSVVRLPE